MLAIAVLFVAMTAEAAWYPDRRKSQFETVFGYALFPYPYSLPGIGQGLGLVGGAMNISDTTDGCIRHGLRRRCKRYRRGRG